jgi:hypothetical protein
MFETAIQQWHAAERRLASGDPALAEAQERVVDAIVAQLRRRLGGAFTSDELVALYEQGTDWCLDLAARTAPDAPWAWDTQLVADAAFGRYLRSAVDYSGGRRSESMR